MNSVAKALEQLTAESMVIRQRAAAPVVAAQRACQQFATTLEQLRQKLEGPRPGKPRIEAEAVWIRFAMAGYELSALNAFEVRALCCSDETALRPEFIAALTKNPERLDSGRCIYGIANAYFSAWRAMKDPAAVERLLTAACERYSGRNPAIQKWRSSRLLFSENAEGWLALAVCAKQRAVNEVLAEYYVGPVTKLGRAVRASAARKACEILREAESSSGPEWSLQYLLWMTENVLSERTLPDDAFYDSIGALILSESARRSAAFQRALRDYAQADNRLGDPRVRESSPKWRLVAPEAAQRYLSWLARDSIIFFFNTILPNSSKNCERRDFWLRYHERIRDFQVAVSKADLWKVRANRGASEAGSYSQVDHPTTSAFLMKFEGYGGAFLVVEFSETGHAANVFNFADFETRGLAMRSPRFDLNNHLMAGRTHRILHVSDWQRKAAYTLAYEFGIQR